MEPLFEIEVSKNALNKDGSFVEFGPRVCLPYDIDRSNFIDITPIGSDWKIFLDTKTGTIHDCSIYYRHLCKIQEEHLL